MNQRERIMGAVVGLGVLFFGAYKVVYPAYVAPLFEHEAAVSRLEDTLEDLGLEIRESEVLKEEYRDYVYRAGGTDPNVVGDQFTSILNDLLNESKLEEKQVSPKGGSEDRKTKTTMLTYNVRAKGPLRQAVMFVKEFYALPDMARFSTLKLSPVKSRRRGGASDIVSLTGTIEVLVPAEYFGGVKDVNVHRPPRLKKYRSDAYASIWEKDPFNKPPPPDKPKPVKPKEAVVKGPTDPGPPPGPVWIPDPNRIKKEVKGCWAPTKEITVVDVAARQREYVGVGQELDGGTVLMVHPYGALVRRPGSSGELEYLYPLGESLADSVPLSQASNMPQLQAIAYRFLRDEPDVSTSGLPAEPGDLAGPPEALAGRLEVDANIVELLPPPPGVESKIIVNAGRTADARPAPDEIAGPPEELAGPLPKESPPPAPDPTPPKADGGDV